MRRDRSSSLLRFAACAAAMILPISTLGAAPAPRAAPVAKVEAPAKRGAARVSARRARLDVARVAPAAPAPVASWAASLAPIEVTNRNTGAHGSIHLYDGEGAFRADEAKAFMGIASSTLDPKKPEELDLRLLKLAARASYHFDGAAISIVSARRAGAGGRHGAGEALDFALEGVTAATLAAYLREYPKAGVGIYTHPKTQYVHLDVRDHSYHWLDASPLA